MNAWGSSKNRYGLLVALGLLLVGIAYWLRAAFKPLLLAALIAYLLYPLVYVLHTRFRIRRKVAANLVYFITLAVLIALPATLVPVLADELQTLVDDLLRIVDQVGEVLAKPFFVLGITFHLQALVPAFKDTLTSFLTPLPQDAWHLLETTSTNALWFLVIVVGVYYLLTSWEEIREWLIHLAPPAYQYDVRRLYEEIRAVWMAYLRGQLTLMLIVAVTFALIWSIIGLPGALILGILGGLFSIIPDVGPFLATVLAVIVALLEGSTWIPWDNIWFAALVAGLYIVLINVKNIWLRPYILGRSVHMHEGLVFIVIIAAVVSTGILGAFLVVPVLASAAVLARYLWRRLLGLPPFSESPFLQSVPARRRESRLRRRKKQP